MQAICDNFPCMQFVLQICAKKFGEQWLHWTHMSSSAISNISWAVFVHKDAEIAVGKSFHRDYSSMRLKWVLKRFATAAPP